MKPTTQTLEHLCACKETIIYDRCIPCKGYNQQCPEYLPLRVYVRNMADEYFNGKKRDRREMRG